MIGRVQSLLRQPVAGACLLVAPAALSQTTVSGVVEDATTHQPIARVLVSSPNGIADVLTDNSGHFSFENISPGAASIRYRRPGYFDPRTMQPFAVQQVIVQDGVPVTLTLLRGASLQGQLTLPDGETAEGMRVELYAAHVHEGHRFWRVTQAGIVDADGHFSFEDLAPGSYTVHSEGSTDPVPQGTQPGLRSGYLPAWPPGNGDVAGATIYVLRSGESGEASITVQRGMYYPVKVPFAGSAPVGNCHVTGNGFTNWPLQNDRRAGALTTTLPSGNYMLHCDGGFARVFAYRQAINSGNDFIGMANSAESSAEQPIRVSGGPVQTAPLALSSTPQLSLSVETQGSDSASTGNAAGNTPPRLFLLTLLPVDGMGEPQYDPVQYDPDGSPRLAGIVPPGQYWVSATVSGGYLAGLSGGGADLASTPLTIAPGNAASISATLGAGGGTLSVTLSGDLLSRTCVLELLPTGGAGTSQTVIVQPGTPIYTFSSLAPGDYLLLATASKTPIAYREPGVLQELGGTPVSVTTGDTAQATISTLTTVPTGASGLP